MRRILLCIALIAAGITNLTAGEIRKSEASVHQIEITPLFFGPPTHEYPFKEEMTVDKLRTMFDNMKLDGINTVLLMGGWGEKVYFPSKILKDSSKIDWYEIAFKMAQERRMQVGNSGIYYTYLNQFLGKTWDPKKDLLMNKKVYRELYARYGHHPNFWGWYIPHESGDRTHRGNIMLILKNLPRFLKKLTPNKKVAYSPWFPSRITLGENEALSPAQTAVEWDAMLDEIDGIDAYVLQDTMAFFLSSRRRL